MFRSFSLAYGSFYARAFNLTKAIRLASSSQSCKPLPDILPFLEQHGSTDQERHLRDVLRQCRHSTSTNDNWQSLKAAYISARFFDYALEMEEDEYERGRLYMQLNQPGAALACYRKALAQSPLNPRILISLAAWHYHQRQDYDISLEYLDRAKKSVVDGLADEATDRTKTEELLIEILKYQGLMHRSKEDYKSALHAYQLANADLDVADMHAALGQWTEAQAIYERLLVEENDDEATRAVLLHNLGNVHAQSNNPERAIMYCQESIELKRKLHSDDLELAKTLNLLGAVYATQNNRPKALSCFQETVVLARSSGEADGENPLIMHAMRNISVLKGRNIPKWTG